jgi:hypothetical protein
MDPGLLFPIFPVSLPSTREELYTTDGWHGRTQWCREIRLPPSRRRRRWSSGGPIRPDASTARCATAVACSARPCRARSSCWPAPGSNPASSPPGWISAFRCLATPRQRRATPTTTLPAQPCTSTASSPANTLWAHYTLLDDPQPGNYQVKMSVRRSLSDMSTKASAVWRFSTDGSLGPLPVQVVRFSPKLDQANTAPGGRASPSQSRSNETPGPRPPRSARPHPLPERPGSLDLP